MNTSDHDALPRTLERRFAQHMPRHADVAWAGVRARIDQDADTLRALRQMEATGGEPDVIGRDDATGRVTFCDCAAESPAGRRSSCNDGEGLERSSWLATPPDVRALGGALFGDRRYGRVFVYHNGAPSYHAARGFRGLPRV